MKENITMEELVNLCKQYGIIFQGSEIYGGLANTWDFGPVGAEIILKKLGNRNSSKKMLITLG